MSNIENELTNAVESIQLFPEQTEILLEKNLAGNVRHPDFNDFDAVFNYVSRLPVLKKLQYRDYQYFVNTTEPIEVAKDIFFQLNDFTHAERTNAITKISFRLYSDNMSMKDLKEFISKCNQEYESHRTNKLGDDIFFFDQTIANDTRNHSALSFDKKKFVTYRTFDNVFFEEKNDVEGRVDHFLNNKEWYIKRGIPYTLGFMFTGPPGTGKTSSIKAIANTTRRHIINVRLSEVKTNSQLKNLFYNPVIQVVNPETLCVETFVVPIHQRLYVIEDIDCMGDLIKKREYQAKTDDAVETEEEEKPKRASKQKKTKKPEPKLEFLDGDEELASYYEDALNDEKGDMQREKDETDKKDKITFDSLLNIFDGTYEIPNRMIAITTNHPEVIDTALIRPGRIDMIVKFKYCTKEIIQQMFESFYEKDFGEKAFIKIKDYKISPAVVNQVLFKYFSNPDAAVEELVTLSTKRNTYKKRADAD